VSVVSFRNEVMAALARAKRRNQAELERELMAAGPECTFDSIHLVRAAVRVAREHGIVLKPTPAIAPSFKSVEGVATLLSSLARGQDAA